MSEQPWGFIVSHDTTDDTWMVSLPHQCDNWDISRGAWDDEQPHDQALANLNGFISEALQARKALKARREFRDGQPA